ncbi:unnamed protein product [Candidula unifasciata]|uniref:CDK5 regulatory subunit-associated protein 3 n=1 Tax=Candidula unifasciata TaxID=100452 RepID=A0A8S3ZQS9_9EUPU|nr:unnamed protein product [Candidula unifasciata]
MTQKSLESLPIDIHYNKLTDWLVNRRHCTQQCPAILTLIRDKLTKAVEETRAELSGGEEVQQLLASPQLNYFQVKVLFDQLKATESGKRNLIGQYTSATMKNWAEIVKLYEKEGTYLWEAAQLIIRNVNYEIPAIKKQISKCQQTQKECQRKENEYASSATDLRRQYKASCKQLGIEGNKIKTELAELVKDLPSELRKFAESARTLEDAVQFYDDFTRFVLPSVDAGSENVCLLKHILSKGNTTTFEWRTGRVPSKVEEVQIKIDLSDEQDAATDSEAVDIDWGAADISEVIDFGDSSDFDLGNITVESGGVLAAEGEVSLETPDVDVIDWEIIDEVPASASGTGSTEADVASGKDALSLIDNPETRKLFVDDLMELQAFLRQRSNELAHESGESSHMSAAPSEIHLDLKTVTAMLTKVKDILDQMTSVRMEHLMLIRDSPRYVDRLRDSLRQKLVLADKMVLSEKEMAGTRLEAIEEEKELEPQLEILRKQTKIIKKQLEEEISKKYNERKVNIVGEINTL